MSENRSFSRGSRPNTPPSRTQKAADVLSAFLNRQSGKTRLLLAAWALFIIWTGWDTLSNGWYALQPPPR